MNRRESNVGDNYSVNGLNVLLQSQARQRIASSYNNTMHMLSESREREKEFDNDAANFGMISPLIRMQNH